jgi:hypothetical protein
MQSKKFCLLSFAASALLMAVGCATPGAPLPPSLNLPRPVEDLKAERKGGRVLITWSEPTVTTDRQNIRSLGATKVCRAFRQFPMGDCVELVKELTASEIKAGSGDGKEKMFYQDTLPAGNADPSGFVTYAIEVRNLRGRSAGLSNQVRVSLAPTLPPPANVKAEVLPDGVRLSWDELRESVPSGLRFHYRVLRRPAGKGPFMVADEVAIGKGMFYDRAFEWEQTYEYKITPITEVAGPQGMIEVQGEDSPVVTLLVHDVFPPERPTAVQAVYSGVGQLPFVDISWAPNVELDLAGYNVYRRQGSAEPVQINKQLVKSPSFRDDVVQPGVTYFYSVSAVDLRGNQSPRSEETSEKVPN